MVFNEEGTGRAMNQGLVRAEASSGSLDTVCERGILFSIN
jgi:hypothetical protein